MSYKRYLVLTLLLLAVSLGILMLAYPVSSWEAGVRGLAIWWDVLFPSLFPFFVISELMLGFGIVHFLGKLLDPLMKPLFRIPGSGGFALAMGFASGYPVSAKLATKLREQSLVSREEGERLVAFTTTSDPIFLIGAVSVGFFGSARLAGAMAIAHYGSALLVGFLMRFYGGKPQHSSASSPQPSTLAQSRKTESRFSLREAVKAMHEARLADGRSLGELLRQAVTSSLQLMTVVGGLVVFFSVILEVLTVSGVMNTLYTGVQLLLPLVGLPAGLAEPFVGGLFEVTLGAKASAAPADIPLMYKAAAAAFILSWGGLSVHAQVASILNGADLRYFPFLIARIIHAVAAAALLLLIWEPLLGATSSVFASSTTEIAGWSGVPESISLFIQVLGVLLGLSLLVRIIHRILSRYNGKPSK